MYHLGKINRLLGCPHKHTSSKCVFSMYHHHHHQRSKPCAPGWYATSPFPGTPGKKRGRKRIALAVTWTHQLHIFPSSGKEKWRPQKSNYSAIAELTFRSKNIKGEKLSSRAPKGWENVFPWKTEAVLVHSWRNLFSLAAPFTPSVIFPPLQQVEHKNF